MLWKINKAKGGRKDRKCQEVIADFSRVVGEDLRWWHLCRHLEEVTTLKAIRSIEGKNILGRRKTKSESPEAAVFLGIWDTAKAGVAMMTRRESGTQWLQTRSRARSYKAHLSTSQFFPSLKNIFEARTSCSRAWKSNSRYDKQVPGSQGACILGENREWGGNKGEKVGRDIQSPSASRPTRRQNSLLSFPVSS